MLNETTEEGGAQRLLVGAKRLWIWESTDLGPNDLFPSPRRLFQSHHNEFVLLRKQLSSEGSLQFLAFFPVLSPCARPKPQVFKHRHARRARVIFLWLKSNTTILGGLIRVTHSCVLGSRIPVNVIIKFSVLVQTLMIVVPKCFTTILQINSFPSFSPFQLISQQILKQTCSFRILLCPKLLSIDDLGTAPSIPKRNFFA